MPPVHLAPRRPARGASAAERGQGPASQPSRALPGTSEMDATAESYRTLVESINDVIFTLDAEGCFTYISPVIERLTGFRVDEVVGRPFAAFVHAEDLPVLNESFQKMLNGILEPAEFRVLAKDGGVRMLRISSRPLREKGEPAGLTGVATDVTERKKAEEALHTLNADLERRVADRTAQLARSNRMLQILSECNQTLVHAADEQELLQAICRHLVDLGGYPSVWIGLAEHDSAGTVSTVAQIGVAPEHLVAAHLGWDGAGPGRGPVGEALRSGQPCVVTAAQADTDLSPWREEALRLGFASSIALPVRGDEGVLGALIIFAAESDAFDEEEVRLLTGLAGDLAFGVTSLRARAQRRLAEESLRESEDRFRRLVELSPDGIFVHSEGRLVFVNTAAVKLLGAKAPEELIGRPVLDFVHPNSRETVVERIRRLKAEGEPAPLAEEIFIRLDGTRVDVEVAAIPLAFEGKPAVQGMARDITERKWAEQSQDAIHRISEASLATQDLNGLFRSIHAIVAELMPAKNFYVALYDSATDLLHFPYFADERDPAPPPLRPAGGLTGYVLRTGRPLLATPEVFERLVRSGDIELLGSESVDWLGAPLKTQLGTTIGVMAVQTYAGAPRLTERHRDVLRFVSTQVATAIARKRVERETRRRLAELEAVNRISTALRAAQTLDEMLPRLLDETLALLDTTAGVIWLYDELSGELRQAIARGWRSQISRPPERSGEGISGMVFATGEPYTSRDFATDPLTSTSIRQVIPAGWGGACVPIRTAERVIGVLVVYKVLPPDSAEEQVRLLITIAEIAGNAIHRAGLHEQTRQHLHRLAALHTIDKTITGSFDLRLSLSVILDRVMDELHVGAADILLLSPPTQTLEFAAGRGFASDEIARSRVRLGDCFAGRAALERRTLSIPDLAESRPEFLRAQALSGERFVAYHCVPLIAKGNVKGVLELFHRAPLNRDRDWVEFMETLGEQAAIAIDSAEMFEKLQRSNIELAVAYDTTLEGWSRALDLRDRETEGHTLRVVEMTLRLARAMGVSEEEMVHVRRGALLHDIGKMGIPDTILLKPGPLTPAEWEIMRKHPTYAYDLLSPIAYLRSALDIPYCHHERWDGTGYPRGLKGEQIPLIARIFAVVDEWDAMTWNRPYRAALPPEQVREYIRDRAGKRFDRRVAEKFLKMVAGPPELASGSAAP